MTTGVSERGFRYCHPSQLHILKTYCISLNLMGKKFLKRRDRGMFTTALHHLFLQHHSFKRGLRSFESEMLSHSGLIWDLSCTEVLGLCGIFIFIYLLSFHYMRHIMNIKLFYFQQMTFVTAGRPVQQSDILIGIALLI